MVATHILYETASGFGLFRVKGMEVIGVGLDEVQQGLQKLSGLQKYLNLVSFYPFKTAADALLNINEISEGLCGSTLKEFLTLNLSKEDSKEIVLGVSEKNLAGSIITETKIKCEANQIVSEFLRGIRNHEAKILGEFDANDLNRAKLGLGHAYSRAKVKFNVNKSDNMIIQSINLLDQIDKDVNTFAMRVREWYSWHFPELSKIVSDNLQYARLIKVIQQKETLTDGQLAAINEVTGDELVSKQILAAARSSMGTDINEVDLININVFAGRVVSLVLYRNHLLNYLQDKMDLVAPNLAALLGNHIGARLIAHAGSLTNLSKCAASTVQILGAEKALFRALKTRGKTPKYGLLFNSSYIGRAAAPNKGRISRSLANKAAIASRIDCYSDNPTSKFGEALKKQMDQRLEFYSTGARPLRNIDVMAKAAKKAKKEADKADEKTAEKTAKKAAKEGSKKRSKSDGDDTEKAAKKKAKSGDKKSSKKVKISS